MKKDKKQTQNISDFKKAVIKEIREEAAGTRSYFFNIPEGVTWDAGSDIHVAHPDFMVSGIPDKNLNRHMSLMTLPEEEKIGFTTRVPGSGSTYKKRLALLTAGDEMIIYKIGNRFPLRRENRPVVLISMGVGMATMRPMIKSWLKDSTGIPSITNMLVDRPDQFVFREELESTKGSNLVNIFSEDRNSFYRNFELLHIDEKQFFYVVGGDGFLEEIIKRLKATGVRPDSIEIDKKPEKKAEMLGL